MFNFLLNPRNDHFKTTTNISQYSFYVDKTDLIAKLNQQISTDDKFICISTPRRFGKTTTAGMLSAYYSKGCDSKELFDRFKIATDPSYTKHLNKYNVFNIEMNGISGFFGDFHWIDKTGRVKDIVDYLHYAIAKHLCLFKEFDDILKKQPDIYDIDIASALSEIYLKTGEQFIFIIDPWDFIFREYRDNDKLQRKYMDFLKSLFNNAKCQQAIALVYLTGILPIKRYNYESALTNFHEYNMLQPGQYGRFFGFTIEEVKQVEKEYNIYKTVTFSKIVEMYNGYEFNDTSIMNPINIRRALSDGSCHSFWLDTGTCQNILDLFELNLEGFQEDYMKLIVGLKVTFTTTTYQNDMVNIKNKDDAFCYLVCLGYIACKQTSEPNILEAYIPNKEIYYALSHLATIEPWFHKMEIVNLSEELLKATFTKDEKKVAEIMDNIHDNSYLSYPSYDYEPDLSKCSLLAYSWALLKNFQTPKKLEDGKGFADIVYIPYGNQWPVLIIELKLDVSADVALTQIRNKQYTKDLASKYSCVLLVAITYNSKIKKHECAIEEYEI